MLDRIRGSFPGAGIPADPAGDGYGWVEQGTREIPKKLTHAAVLVPIINRPQGLTVLLTQRTAHLKSHAGQVSFPGGRENPEDESPEDTALRETHEEIGVPPEHIELVGRLNVRTTGTGYKVTPVVGLLQPPFPMVAEPGEVAEIFEVPLDHAMDPVNHTTEKHMMEGVEREFYVVPFEDYFIWGLTARLIINLSEHLGEL